jgi:hypothetical protein
MAAELIYMTRLCSRDALDFKNEVQKELDNGDA